MSDKKIILLGLDWVRVRLMRYDVELEKLRNGGGSVFDENKKMYDDDGIEKVVVINRIAYSKR